jgi:hypothetical protein
VIIGCLIYFSLAIMAPFDVGVANRPSYAPGRGDRTSWKKTNSVGRMRSFWQKPSGRREIRKLGNQKIWG